MATITTDTYLDGGTARTAGEAWTINGGVLRIRTDTRVHANAPASYTGSLGSLTISGTLGGKIYIDGRNVRWLAYTGGSGNVPAIGTNVTKAGVVTSSYLLGVYASMTAAPTAVGAAMPSTGFIKFREVDGAFTAGALTGIGATAAGADVVGWIEVVMREAATVTVPRLGRVEIRGDWFYLGNTSGSANQVIQIPTNGGGSNTHVPAVWIETGAGTGIYESWPALTNTHFLAANLGTDARNKFVRSMGSGQVNIGHDGTTTAGFVPPAGCRVRIPNVIGRGSVVANDALNVTPNATLGTRPDFTTSSAGDIDIEYFLNDWYLSFTSPYRVVMKHSATFDVIPITNAAVAYTLDNVVVGGLTGTTSALLVTSCSLGGDISNSKFARPGATANGFAASFVASAALTGTNNYFIVTILGRSNVQHALNFDQVVGATFYDTYTMNGGIRAVTSSAIRLYDIDHTDCLKNNTIATQPRYVLTATISCADIVVDRITFGLKGLVSNVSPYAGMLFTANSKDITFKNAGTRAAPLHCTSGFAPAYIYQDGGLNLNIKVQNVFLDATRINMTVGVNTSIGCRLENCHGTVGSVLATTCGLEMKGVRMTSVGTTAQPAVYGTHVADGFLSDTTGVLWFLMNEPLASTASQVTTTFGTNAGFTAVNEVALPNTGDQVIIEMPYFALGHTAFANSAPTITGSSGNVLCEYDLDLGSGFSGTYKTVSGANLSAETINPSIGFKMRFRVTATVTNAATSIRVVQIPTVSTLLAQGAGLYPLGRDVKITLGGLEAGTEIIYFNSANVELDREVVSGTTYEYHYLQQVEDIPTTGNYFLIWKDNKTPLWLTGITQLVTDQIFNVTLAEDLVYSTPVAPISTFNSGSKLQILDSGVTDVTVSELYSDWKDWLRVSNNAQYDAAYSQLGGNAVTPGISVPYFVFLENGWKIRPHEANHTLVVSGGTLVASGDPFQDTVGNYRVRINYQQPVQAIALGGSSLTAQDVRNAMTLAPTDTPATGSLDDKLTKIKTDTALVPGII